MQAPPRKAGLGPSLFRSARAGSDPLAWRWKQAQAQAQALPNSASAHARAAGEEASPLLFLSFLPWPLPPPGERERTRRGHGTPAACRPRKCVQYVRVCVCWPRTLHVPYGSPPSLSHTHSLPLDTPNDSSERERFGFASWQEGRPEECPSALGKGSGRHICGGRRQGAAAATVTTTTTSTTATASTITTKTTE